MWQNRSSAADFAPQRKTRHAANEVRCREGNSRMMLEADDWLAKLGNRANDQGLFG